VYRNCNEFHLQLWGFVGQASGNELKQKKFLNVENGSDSGSTAANCPLMSCSLVGYAKKKS